MMCPSMACARSSFNNKSERAVIAHKGLEEPKAHILDKV